MSIDHGSPYVFLAEQFLNGAGGVMSDADGVTDLFEKFFPFLGDVGLVCLFACFGLC